jgi:hypothetical protein
MDVIYCGFSIDNMFFISELLCLLSGYFSSAAICFVPKKTNLYIDITFFSEILKPVSNMVESRSSRNIKNNKCSIHIPIVTILIKFYLIVNER